MSEGTDKGQSFKFKFLSLVRKFCRWFSRLWKKCKKDFGSCGDTGWSERLERLTLNCTKESIEEATEVVKNLSNEDFQGFDESLKDWTPDEELALSCDIDFNKLKYPKGYLQMAAAARKSAEQHKSEGLTVKAGEEKFVELARMMYRGMADEFSEPTSLRALPASDSPKPPALPYC